MANNNNRQTIANMIAPQISESDATMVDVYGLKSQAADNMAGAHTMLAGLGMIPAVGNVADAVDTMLYLTEGDIGGAGLSALSMIPFAGLFAGGLKTAKSGAKVIKGTKKLDPFKEFGPVPRTTKKMPKSQYQYERPEFKPNPTGVFRNQKTGMLTKAEPTYDKLYRELISGDLDTFEFQEKLFKLEQISPEKANKVLETLGY